MIGSADLKLIAFRREGQESLPILMYNKMRHFTTVVTDIVERSILNPYFLECRTFFTINRFAVNCSGAFLKKMGVRSQRPCC